MKKTKGLIGVLLVLVIFLAFASCNLGGGGGDTGGDSGGDGGDSGGDTGVITGQTLVMVKRGTGELFVVDPSDGSMTLKGVIQENGSAISGLRGLVYDPATGKGYLSSTNSNGGKIYSLNMATLAATELNDNAADDWEGMADGVLYNGDLLFELTSNTNFESSLSVIQTDGTVGTHNELWDVDGEYYHESSGGLTYGRSSTEFIIGGNDSNLLFSTYDGNISGGLDLNESTNISMMESALIMDLEKYSDTMTYALVYNEDTGYQYFSRINFITGDMTEIKQLAYYDLLDASTKNSFMHCMAFIPETVVIGGNNP